MCSSALCCGGLWAGSGLGFDIRDEPAPDPTMSMLSMHPGNSSEVRTGLGFLGV